MKIAVSALAMRNRGGGENAGIPRYEFRLIEHFLQESRGHQFVIYHGEWFVPPEAWRARPDFEFVEAQGPFRKMKTVWDTLSAGHQSRKRRVDVHMSCAHALPWAYTGKTVLVVHDLFVVSHPEFFTRKTLLVFNASLRRSIRQATRIASVSDHTRRELVELMRVDPAKIAVTHLGPGNVIQRIPAEDAEISHLQVPFRRYLFTLSTLEPRKNLKRLCEALALLRQDPLFSDLGLVVTGARGWNVSELPAHIEQLGLTEAVHFTGYVEDADLPKLFARAEAFVMASITEGFGLPVLEAMLAGAPVVCSKAGALPEVCGSAGETFDPLDPKDIARALRARLQSPEPRESVIQRGLEQARQFDWRRTASQTLDLLEQAARA